MRSGWRPDGVAVAAVSCSLLWLGTRDVWCGSANRRGGVSERARGAGGQGMTGDGGGWCKDEQEVKERERLERTLVSDVGVAIM